MTTLGEAFEERVSDIERFFSLLETTETVDADLASMGLQENTWPMLKATGFLVLYNLVEASMRDGVAAIYDALEAARVSYDDLVPCLRCVVASNMRRKKPEHLGGFLELSRDVVTKTFESDHLFAGNVDARRVRKVATAYGGLVQT